METITSHLSKALRDVNTLRKWERLIQQVHKVTTTASFLRSSTDGGPKFGPPNSFRIMHSQALGDIRGGYKGKSNIKGPLAEPCRIYDYNVLSERVLSSLWPSALVSTQLHCMSATRNLLTGRWNKCQARTGKYKVESDEYGCDLRRCPIHRGFNT